MSQQVSLRPSKAFGGNVGGMDRSAKVQKRMAARPVTAMASATMEEVPTPEKRVRLFCAAAQVNQVLACQAARISRGRKSPLRGA